MATTSKTPSTTAREIRGHFQAIRAASGHWEESTPDRLQWLTARLEEVAKEATAPGLAEALREEVRYLLTT